MNMRSVSHLESEGFTSYAIVFIFMLIALDPLQQCCYGDFVYHTIRILRSEFIFFLFVKNIYK